MCKRGIESKKMSINFKGKNRVINKKNQRKENGGKGYSTQKRKVGVLKINKI